jgi:1-acyl-sn-glycerol-3-phosphate acyltransferase
VFKKHNKERGFKLRRTFAKLGRWILGIKVELKGELNNSKPSLFVINHRSLVDPLIIAAHIDAFFVSKAEVSSYPVLGPGAQKTGVIFVQRDSKSSRSATLKAIQETFEKGENIIIFPEGTTNLYKLTKQYRIGSFRIAADMKIPVVPVVLEYKDHKDLWNSNSMVKQFIKQFGAWNTFTKVQIGKPILSDDPLILLKESQSFTDEILNEMHKDWTTMKFDALREPID